MKKFITHLSPVAPITALLLLSTLFLPSCFGGPENAPQNSTAKLPEICNTLDDTIIATTLETATYTIKPLEGLATDIQGCKYLASDRITPTKTFNFIRREEETPDKAKESYYKAVNVWQNSQMDNRELSYEQNVGDEAFFAYGEKTPQLITYKDNILLIITFGNLKKDYTQILAKAKTIATPLLQK